jgi:hypothetical protein
MYAPFFDLEKRSYYCFPQNILCGKKNKNTLDDFSEPEIGSYELVVMHNEN